MKNNYAFCLLLISFLFLAGNSNVFAQQNISGTFISNGQTRSYLGAVPDNPQSPMRLVLLFCGAGEGASQMVLRGFNNYLGNNSMVIYPEPDSILGYNNSQGVDDFQMVEDLISDVVGKYNVDVDDICIGGFSNGGIFSYNLVCDFNSSGSNRAYKFKSFAIVSGAMEDSTINFSDCPVAGEIPLIVFHGTQDPLITINGGWIMPINLFHERLDTTLAFWANQVNGCNRNPAVTLLPDLETETPNSTVELHEYTCNSSPNTKFYRILGGFHSWPSGNASIDSAQAANRDINASELIAEFFENPSTTSTKELSIDKKEISIFPNPVNNQISILNYHNLKSIEIINPTGKIVFSESNPGQSIEVNQLKPGVYFVKIESQDGVEVKKIIKK